MNIKSIKDFVVFDFETATHDRHVCQVGIAVVRGMEITDSTAALVRPPENRYDKDCTRVHHITPVMTEDAPTFDQYYKHTKEIMENHVVVMHNADFDLDVLNRACDHYGLPRIRPRQVFCTYRLYGHSLADLCAGFGMDCEGHHDAEFDARCTAQFLINWLNGVEPDESKYGVKEDIFSKGHKRIKGAVLQKDLTGADPSHIFYNKKVVITGVFPMDRTLMAERVKACGADIDTGVTKRTAFVLAGDDPGPKKMEKAMAFQKEGYGIRILRWDDFKDMI